MYFRLNRATHPRRMGNYFTNGKPDDLCLVVIFREIKIYSDSLDLGGLPFKKDEVHPLQSRCGKPQRSVLPQDSCHNILQYVHQY